jgi:hypothetical protein
MPRSTRHTTRMLARQLKIPKWRMPPQGRTRPNSYRMTHLGNRPMRPMRRL